MRIGIFGGSFNPPHLGHLNSMETVLKKTGLNKILVIPNSQNPLKPPVEGADANHRLNMLNLALQDYGDSFIIDDRELKRGGKSYSIDTLKELRSEYLKDELFLILGMDQLEVLNEWKDFEEIFQLVNLIITSRPGNEKPYAVEDFPDWFQPHINEFDKNYLELKTGRYIMFVQLNDVDVSSSQLRKDLRTGKQIHKFLPLAVEKYIKENKLYDSMGAKIKDYKSFTEFCAKILFEKKGINVRGFDITALNSLTDYALICSGTSTRHTSALMENVIKAVKEEYGVYPLSIEGIHEGRWVLLDYGSLIIHSFYEFIRNDYNLEQLWKSGKMMDIAHLDSKPSGKP